MSSLLRSLHNMRKRKYAQNIINMYENKICSQRSKEIRTHLFFSKREIHQLLEFSRDSKLGKNALFQERMEICSTQLIKYSPMQKYFVVCPSTLNHHESKRKWHIQARNNHISSGSPEQKCFLRKMMNFCCFHLKVLFSLNLQSKLAQKKLINK